VGKVQHVWDGEPGPRVRWAQVSAVNHGFIGNGEVADLWAWRCLRRRGAGARCGPRDSDHEDMAGRAVFMSTVEVGVLGAFRSPRSVRNHDRLAAGRRGGPPQSPRPQPVSASTRDSPSLQAVGPRVRLARWWLQSVPAAVSLLAGIARHRCLLRQSIGRHRAGRALPSRYPPAAAVDRRRSPRILSGSRSIRACTV
jgi:hypothetical protein